PEDIAARGIAAPFTSFRDRGAHPLLNYAPLEEAIRRYPDLEQALEVELSPGSGYCTLDPEEYDVARAALNSRFEVVRRHARVSLENAGEILSTGSDRE